MLDIKQFISAMHQIAEEKGIQKDRVLETIELAIAAAYKKDYGEKSQIVRVKLDPETGDMKVTRVHIVVEGTDAEGYLIGEIPELGRHEKGKTDKEEEEVKIKFNEEKHILLDEAHKQDKKLKVGDEVVSALEPKTEFGRIAAQTAKQVIIQRLKEIEREAILEEFKGKEGEVVSGVVQRMEGRTAFIDLGRTNGVLPPPEQVPTERYRIGQRLKFFIAAVEETNRGPSVILSRSHPGLVIRLFEFEVPEMEAGEVEIKAIAREAGSRSKVAVATTDEGIDPIGSLVGQKGSRVQTVINELSGEKIDIIEWHEDIATFIGKALSPAKVLAVKILDAEARHALVEVAEDQFSLAIGKKGQNVRLAAKLTGWKLDVRAPQGALSSDEASKEADGSEVAKDTQSEGEAPEDSVEK